MNNWLRRRILHLSESISKYVDSAPIAAEERHRLRHYTIFLLLGIPTMVAFGIYNLAKSNYLLCTLILFSSFGLSVGLYFLGRLTRGIIVYRINLLLFALLLLYMLVFGGEGGSKILWMYTLPLIVFFLLGTKEGILWVGSVFMLASLLLGIKPKWIAVYDYNIHFTIRFLVTFVIVSSIAYGFEHLR